MPGRSIWAALAAVLAAAGVALVWFSLLWITCR